MNNYQIVIDGEDVSQPMDKEGAAAWVVLLRLNFPGANIQAESLLCPECGLILPDAGPCWHNRFEEEELEIRPTLAEMMATEAEIRAKIETELHGRPISSGPIPFQGEAFPAKVYSEFEEYF